MYSNPEVLAFKDVLKRALGKQLPRIIRSTKGVKKLRNYIQRSKHVQHEDSHVYYVRDDYAARKVCSSRVKFANLLTIFLYSTTTFPFRLH